MHFVQDIRFLSAICLATGLATAIAGCGAEADTPPQGRVGAQKSSTTGNGAAGTGTGDFGNSEAPAMEQQDAAIVNSGANGCAPGHYVGSFKGTYNTAAWGNGSFPLSVEAVSSMGQPGLEFWLEATSAPCTNSEFCADFTVKGGKIRGFANPFSDPNAKADAGAAANPLAIAVRFEIDFGGDLDCSTGEFKGLLQNGCYDVATTLYRFEGTAPAQYDRASSSFTQGEWIAKEMPNPGVIFPPDSKIGGMGTWGATLTDDGSSPVAAGMGLCDK